MSIFTLNKFFLVVIRCTISQEDVRSSMNGQKMNFYKWVKLFAESYVE